MQEIYKNKAFTLVELLAVIVILAIVLAIAIPSISSVIDNSEKNSFVSSTKLLINAVKIKLLEDETFDITTINKDNLKSILNIDDENYSYVSFNYDSNDKIYANIEGQGKWANLVTCGNYENISTIDTDCIIKDGLALHLDASNSDSYSGSGTTWYDISGNNNNCTLANGVGYNSSNSGSLVFDGTDDEVICTNNASVQITVGTISAWIKANNGNTGINGIIAKQSAWGLFVWDNTLRAFDWGNGVDRNTGITVGNDTWKYVTMTFTETVGTPSNNAIIYINGAAVLTTTVKHVNQNITVQVGEANAAQHFGGNISNVQIYNRVLNASEVQQNYNALKSRYGL